MYSLNMCHWSNLHRYIFGNDLMKLSCHREMQYTVQCTRNVSDGATGPEPGEESANQQAKSPHSVHIMIGVATQSHNLTVDQTQFLPVWGSFESCGF